jgi:hypothetical protein
MAESAMAEQRDRETAHLKAQQERERLIKEEQEHNKLGDVWPYKLKLEIK